MKPTDITLNQKLIEIQTRFKSKKSRFNSFGKYYFRAAEDILEAVKPFLKELGVTVTINEELISDNNQPIIIGGDFNVIPNDEDVYSPENFKNDACAHPLTREKFRNLLNLGFVDTVKYFVDGNTNWTFWGYRGGNWQKGNGLRIDHFLTTPEVTDLIKSVNVNREPRGWEKASDHTPVTIELVN